MAPPSRSASTSDPDPASASGPEPDRPRARLTRDAVLVGAVALADELGVEPLTIRRLADRLGVKPMALYHHVASKEAILDGMVDLVFAEIEPPPADRGWKEAMRIRASSAREVLARHRWAAPLMESRTNPGPATLGHHDSVIGCLRGAGFSMAMVGHAYAVIDAFIYGFALQEASLPFDSGDDVGEIAAEMLAAVPAGAFPNLMALAVEHVMQPGYDFGREFDFGLDLILDGLEAAAAREADGASPTRRPTRRTG